jgi:hypothetical protein
MTVDPARRLAVALDRHGLAAPARLLADAHRPLGPLLADLGAAIGPLARAVGGGGIGPLTRWLEDPQALDRLVDALDAGGDARAEPG